MSAEDKKITNELERMLNKQKAMLGIMDEISLDLKSQTLTPELVLTTPVEHFNDAEEALRLSHFMKKYPALRVFGRYEHSGTLVATLCFNNTLPLAAQCEQALAFIPFLTTIPKVISAPLKVNGKHLKIGKPGASELALIFPEHRPAEVWLVDDNELVTQIIRRFKNTNEALQYVFTQFAVNS